MRAVEPTSRNPRHELERELGEIEEEAVRIRVRATEESGAAAACEGRAMKAVRDGDNAAALEALQQHAQHFEAAETLQHDLVILEAMAEACRETLAARR